MTAQKIPSLVRQIMVKKLGTNFREVTEIASNPLPPLGPKEILVKTRFIGINASDINFTAGRYMPGTKPPFIAGFEGMGEVVMAGEEARVKPGQNVAYVNYGAFSEYKVLPAKQAVPIPTCDPGFLSLMVSGLTASIALEKEADLQSGKKVLVTAAAGGTGQFAVQLAKLAGCHVIGTCSTDEKAQFLKSIGCDRTVNYKQEKLKDVLQKEYPDGIDVVYESVGGEIFETALKNLAVHGRLIVIGLISTYEGKKDIVKNMSAAAASMILLTKSASMRSFFLNHFFKDVPSHWVKLAQLYSEGKIKVFTDLGEKVPTGPFVGLEKVVDAIDYMYTGKNIGKVVVELNKQVKSSL